MAYDLQFVDSISATPGVRLNLNAPGWTVREGTEFGMPQLDRAVVRTLLVDGDRYPAAAYGNRVLSLVLRVDAASGDDVAGQLQRLYRELDRPSNILMYRPGTSAPVFFRTFRAGPDSVVWDPFTKEATAQVPAEPFALGLREALPAVTVYNDPAEGTTLNANPYFETATQVEGGFEVDMAGYVGINGTAVRSTAQAHAGVASALVTPSGSGVVARVEADMSTAMPAVAGQSFTAEAWVRPTNATKPAAVQITWRDSGGAFVSSTVATAAATAGAWQFLTVTANCPVGAAFAQPAAGIGSTPTAADTAFVDELRLSTPASWFGVGGTVVRSTAQFREGVASLLFTPDGVTANVDARSENVAVTVGQQYRASVWVRSAVARSVSVNINWRDAGGAFLSLSTSSVALAATTWTLLEVTGTAPALAASALLTVSMSSTPPSSNTLHIDEARLRLVGGAGGMSFDVTSPRGDVEAPLFLSVRASDVARIPESPGTGRRQSVIAVRRGGTPSAMPAVLQAESLFAGAETSVQAASGASAGSILRTAFVAATSLQVRGTAASPFPASPSTDARGTYRVFLRCRKSVSGDTMQVQLQYVNSSASVLSDLVTLPAGTVWRWVDMGLVQLPLGYDPVVDGLSGVPMPVAGVSVQVLAARAAGSGNLDLDAIMFAPADDRLCLVKWPAAFSSETAYVVDSVAGQAYGVGASGEIRATLLELIGGGPMVSPGVANRVWMWRDVGPTYEDGDDVTASMQVTPYYWPRYLHVRPVAS